MSGSRLEYTSSVLSTLDPAGRDAEQIALLFWVMTAGTVAIWLAMTALALYAARENRPRWTAAGGYRLILVGGIVFPTLVLAALLGYSLPSLARLLEPAPPGQLTIAVSGEQWWWRVRYTTPAGEVAELANELRLPVGAVADVSLSSDNVIHSFWIPSLAGKVDMIPGRTTRLSLEPVRTGSFRGVCAEYCGASHALMGFAVEVMEADAFEEWLAAETRGAVEPVSAGGHEGRRLFSAHGCAACHTVRGTAADGRIGPDLTHVGGRLTLAAAALPNTREAMVSWITKPKAAKPGSLMPGFGMLPPADLQAIAAYMSELK
jgi:cytochrome c oxidase subunit 2